ncbi:MAG: isocitrate lyase/PEP mutase family protein [Betaproteobacteria bacterium]|nr:isocitrate lyase/PEP mutase family protein [Betaproteobacteria bacterium]MDH3438334.1 isocitrate lyase/PEP mutase family protein [Betaproteobacteria bacterium]
MSYSNPRKRLRDLLASKRLIVAPGIYDAYGACLVEQAGFEAVYMTGNGVSASLLGRPDVGLVDLTMITAHAHRVASAVEIPLICDADTGYGNAVNVRRTVQEFEAAGLAAIHLEDQASPKRCGHLPGSRPVVPLEEAVGKIEAAVAARRDPDFVIIARTDAATGEGLEEAIRRGKAFHAAGADVIFVELKGSDNVLEELRRVAQAIEAPCLVNVEEAGKVGGVTARELEDMGFRIAIYPGLGRYAAGFAIREALGTLKRDGSTRAALGGMLTFKEYNDVLKLSEIEKWERRYLR